MLNHRYTSFSEKGRGLEVKKPNLIFFIPIIPDEVSKSHFINRLIFELRDSYRIHIFTESPVGNNLSKEVSQMCINLNEILHLPMSKLIRNHFQSFNHIDTTIINLSSEWLYNNVVNLKMMFPWLKVIDFMFNSHRLRNHLNVSTLIDLTIVQHESFANFLRACESHGIISINSLGVDTELFVRQEKPVRNSVVKFGWIGRYSPEKRLEQFFVLSEIFAGQAFFEVASLDKESIENEIQKKSSNMRLLEIHDDENKIKWYKSIDVLINTSSIEGLPISIIEARSLGIPIVSYNVGGISDIYTNLKDSFIVNYDNFSELQNCVQKIIHNPKTLDSLRENLKVNFPDISMTAAIDKMRKDINFVRHQFHNKPL
jgi:glycosyltransferase involved in cell wall biosynthesis